MVLLVLFNNCSMLNNKTNTALESKIQNSQKQRSNNNKIKVLIDDQNQKMIELERQIKELNETVDKQKQIIDEI